MTVDELNDAGARLAAVGRLAEAEASLRRVLAQAPGHLPARKNLGIVLMAQGRYRDAAPYYRDRHLVGAAPKPSLPFPEWRGEPIAGKRLAIFPEQGLGDQIQFARFAVALVERGVDVTLLCAPPLARLFRSNFEFPVIAAAGEVSFPDPDVWCLANDLVLNMAASPDEVPRPPYLRAEPARRGGIGVKTRGNPAQANDDTRSLPDDLAAELLATPGVVNLEPEATGARDFHDTAEIVAGLDLVISVCTSVAHLAGAMGRPLWLMLPHRFTDWRWMRGRDDSPWYPSARLFRETEAGGWARVVREVRRALDARAA